MEFHLPNSSESWSRTKKFLSCSCGDLDELISVLQQLTKENTEFVSLLKINEYLEENNFWVAIFPSIQKIALKLETLFPNGSIPRLIQGKNNKISFNREQVACLLAHMFFCTLKKDVFIKYWTSFDVWYSTNSGPVLVYLKVLIQYFSQLANGNLNLDEQIIFYRRVLTEEEVPLWSKSEEKLCIFEIKETGKIGDSEGTLEVDFANEDISYGRGGTQEEIMFGMSPELDIAVLLCDSLSENETILIQGAKIIGDYSGYGLDLKYKSTCDQKWNWNHRFIVTMDALSFAVDDSFYIQNPFYDEEKLNRQQKLKQLEEPNLNRELKKSFCGFKPVEVEGFPRIISTGNWGCGAYGGDPEIKAVIQWISASQNHHEKLVYHTFGDSEITEKLKELKNKFENQRVQELWNFLQSLKEKLK